MDQQADDTDALAGVWAEFSEAQHHPGPAFGSAGWVELDRDDPRRQAAIVRAAFQWWAAEQGVGAGPVSPQDLRDASHAIAAAIPEQRQARRHEALHGRVSPAIEYPPVRP